MDLAFAVDDWGTIATNASGVYDNTKWNYIRGFTQLIVGKVGVSSNATHVAVFTFGQLV